MKLQKGEYSAIWRRGVQGVVDTYSRDGTHYPCTWACRHKGVDTEGGCNEDFGDVTITYDDDGTTQEGTYRSAGQSLTIYIR